MAGGIDGVFYDVGVAAARCCEGAGGVGGELGAEDVVEVAA